MDCIDSIIDFIVFIIDSIMLVREANMPALGTAAADDAAELACSLEELASLLRAADDFAAAEEAVTVTFGATGFCSGTVLGASGATYFSTALQVPGTAPSSNDVQRVPRGQSLGE